MASIVCGTNTYFFTWHYSIEVFGLDCSLIFHGAGLWTSVPVLQADETWIHLVLVQHPGAVVFMFFDTTILISCFTLLTAQLYQVTN